MSILIGHSILAHTGNSRMQTLTEHMANVGCLCRVIGKHIEMEHSLILLAENHDNGKSLPGWQNYLLGKGERIGHSWPGAISLFQEIVRSGKPEFFARHLAQIVASHHSGLYDNMELHQIGDKSYSHFVAQHETCKKKAGQILDILGERLPELVRENASESYSEWMMAMKKLVRGLDVDTSCQEGSPCHACPTGCGKMKNPTLWFMVGLLDRLLLGILVKADHYDSATWEAGDKRPDTPTWDDLADRYRNWRKCFDRMPDTAVNRVRNALYRQACDAAEKEDRLVCLSSRTGTGKTASVVAYGLGHARKYEKSRIIYVASFISVLEQTAGIMFSMFGKTNVNEYHSCSYREDADQINDETRAVSADWNEKIVCTTFVQIFEAFYGRGTKNAKRMADLVNAVIIFDEPQSIPVNCVHLFCNMVNFLVKMCNSTVVICTATPPGFDKVKYKWAGYLDLNKALQIGEGIDYSVFDSRVKIDSRYIRKHDGTSVNCDIPEMKCHEVAGILRELVDKHGSVLCIVNTKKVARDIADQIGGMPGQKVICLTTGKCAQHRAEEIAKISKWLANKRAGLAKRKNQKLIVVSTQLVEAGVDLDFPVVVRSLTGLSSIVQAAGRDNRNGYYKDARLYLVKLNEEKISGMKEINYGQEATRDILRNNPEIDLLSPSALEKYYEFYYGKFFDEMLFKTGENENLIHLLSCSPNDSSDNSLSAISGRQQFRTANEAFKMISDLKYPVVVPYGKGNVIWQELMEIDEKDALARPYEYEPMLRRLDRRAQRYIVGLSEYELKVLRDNNGLAKECKQLGIRVLNKEFYDEKYGLLLEPKDMEEMIVN